MALCNWGYFTLLITGFFEAHLVASGLTCVDISRRIQGWTFGPLEVRKKLGKWFIILPGTPYIGDGGVPPLRRELPYLKKIWPNGS